MNTQLAEKHRFSLLKSEQKTRGADTRVVVGSITRGTTTHPAEPSSFTFKGPVGGRDRPVVRQDNMVFLPSPTPRG